MDLIWPIVVLLGTLTLLAAAPAVGEGVKRARIGLAVLRDELIVQHARRVFQKAMKR